MLSKQWAEQYGVPFKGYPAPWGAFGKGAGFLRNTEMLRIERPDLVISFRGNEGTAHCVREAKRMGIPVEETWRR
jgi:hypothetical protein